MLKLFGKTKVCSLPNANSDEELASKFSQYFVDKISSIRVTLQSNTRNTPDSSTNTFSGTELREFVPVTETQVLANDSKATSCEIDLIPTKFMLQFCDVLLPVIVSIINTSLHKGAMPSVFKTAIVKPLLKKSNLDK